MIHRCNIFILHVIITPCKIKRAACLPVFQCKSFITSYHIIYHAPKIFSTARTIRYEMIDDLHWKTDRQAASFI